MKTGETVANWVSVDDALPDFLKKVLVVVESKDCNRFISEDSMMPKPGKFEFEWGFEGVDETAKVSYWAYLPELPERK